MIRRVATFGRVRPLEDTDRARHALQGFGYALHVRLAGTVCVRPQHHGEAPQDLQGVAPRRAGRAGYGAHTGRIHRRERVRRLFALHDHDRHVGRPPRGLLGAVEW